jgi:tetratricopeptide (TPR) repeat protein
VRAGTKAAAGDAQAAFAAALEQHNAGNLREADALYRQALSINPRHADSLHLLGVLAHELGRYDVAAELIGRAITINAKPAVYHMNLGSALKRLGRLDEAARACNAAIARQPDFPEAQYNLATILADQGKLPEAATRLRRVIAARPNFAQAHDNLGTVLKEQGLVDDAIASFRAALAHDPGLTNARHNLALTLLLRGNWPEGWVEYECRWDMPGAHHPFRQSGRPQWRGEPGGGRTLLIHAEQGFGDTLQFCRYARFARDLGWRVILEVPPPLLRLLRTLDGVAALITPEDARPDFDAYCPMLSLPLALGTTLADIPGETPYLSVDAAAVAAWHARLAPFEKGWRVGLVWSGGTATASDPQRSLPPDRLAPILDLPGVIFVSLQKSETPAPAPLLDFASDLTDFADTAALIMALDLVISVDTAVAHLAGALGKPVWLLNRFDPDWRWLLHRTDSPWYPILRQYRQAAPGAWDGVIAVVANDLAAFTKPRRQRD